MPASYRVEVSGNNRATCQNTECKKAAIKITKGEIRHGSLVEIDGHQSWRWKHWGCVTPQQFETWKEISDGDMNLVDGYDELPDDVKAKVERCIGQGHVDDEDWKGDVQKNRPGQKGFRLTKKDRKELGLDDEEGDEEAKPKKGAKRSKKAAGDDGDDEDQEPPAKKAKSGKKAEKDDGAAGDDGAAPAKRGRGRPKKEEADADADEDVKVPVKKSRGKVKKEEADEDDVKVPIKKERSKVKKEEDDEPVPAPADTAPKKGRGRPKKEESTNGVTDIQDTKKKAGRPKKSTEEVPSAAAASEPKKGRGRPKKAAPEPEPEADAEVDSAASEAEKLSKTQANVARKRAGDAGKSGKSAPDGAEEVKAPKKKAGRPKKSAA